MGGCISAKGDINDRLPNVFHVWNVDELGNVLVPGQIQITDTELVLYQKGKEPIRWPMRCLRRYGFDAELFSFESGRRCATGTGIYAFKCRRAEALFNLLQEHIQNSGQDNLSNPGGVSSSHSGVGNGVVVAAAAAANGSILRTGSLSVSDVGNYLEPIMRNRTRSNASRDGFSRMAPQSLPSNLAFADNNGNAAVAQLQVGNGNAALPHYVNEDVVSLNSAGGGGGQETRRMTALRSPLTPPATLPLLHEYSNTDIIASECEEAQTVAISAVTVRPRSLECPTTTTSEESAKTSSKANKVLYSILDLPKGVVGAVKGSNGCRQVVLRGHSLDESSNYARLDDLLKQEHTAQRHLYMNVVPDNVQKNSGVSGGSNGPITSSVYTIGQIGRQKSIDSPSMSSVSSNCAVASASSAKETNTNQSSNHHHHNNNTTTTTHHQHHSHSNSYHSGMTATAVNSRQVNYAVLDLNHRGSSSSGGSISMGGCGNGGGGGAANGGGSGGCETAPTSPTSIATPPESLCRNSLEGYATIDFDRTVALSNSAHPCLDDGESVRKTRHNSTINDLLLCKHGSVVSE